MIVVSDTSVISGLIKIQQLSLLQKVFSSIIMPPKVQEELYVLKDFGYTLSEFEQAEWIAIKVPSDIHLIQQLSSNINSGEAEAIALALELQADFILIDERKGRNVAEQYGLTVTGLIGILIKAKEIGHIMAIKPLLDALIVKQFRISPVLYQMALSLANE